MSDNVFIRLVNPAWAGHNGYFAQVPFKDGRSTRPVTRQEADVLAALTRVETEEGQAVGMAHRLIGGATLPAPILEPLARQSEEEKAVEDTKASGAQAPEEAVLKVYTIEELQAVADKDGISGLRAIAKPLGVKGRAITELLSEITRAQSERFGKPAQEPAPEEAPTETTTQTSGGVTLIHKEHEAVLDHGEPAGEPKLPPEGVEFTSDEAEKGSEEGEGDEPPADAPEGEAA